MSLPSEHQREGGTPFPSQNAIIVDCSCGETYVVPSGGHEYETMEFAQARHEVGTKWEPGPNGETYWLKTGPDYYAQVSLETWCGIERSCGFRPKPGCGPAATGGFSSGSIRGVVIYPEIVLRLWEEQNA